MPRAFTGVTPAAAFSHVGTGTLAVYNLTLEAAISCTSVDFLRQLPLVGGQCLRLSHRHTVRNHAQRRCDAAGGAVYVSNLLAAQYRQPRLRHRQRQPQVGVYVRSNLTVKYKHDCQQPVLPSSDGTGRGALSGAPSAPSTFDQRQRSDVASRRVFVSRNATFLATTMATPHTTSGHRRLLEQPSRNKFSSTATPFRAIRRQCSRRNVRQLGSGLLLQFDDRVQQRDDRSRRGELCPCSAIAVELQSTIMSNNSDGQRQRFLYSQPYRHAISGVMSSPANSQSVQPMPRCPATPGSRIEARPLSNNGGPIRHMRSTAPARRSTEATPLAPAAAP